MATVKEKLWLTEYYKCFNATEAARRVGYKWPNKQGPALKEKFADEIAATLAELTLTKEQVLARLGEQATGDLGEFANIRAPKDLAVHPKSYLVHKLQTRVRRDKEGRVTITTEIELYNAQTALVHIGKAQGLFDNDAPGTEEKPFVVKIFKGVSTDDL